MEMSCNCTYIYWTRSALTTLPDITSAASTSGCVGSASQTPARTMTLQRIDRNAVPECPCRSLAVVVPSLVPMDEPRLGGGLFQWSRKHRSFH